MDLCYVLEKQSIVPSQSQSVLLTPPKKLTKSYYRCDNRFHLDTILEMFEDGEKIGVCLISGRELMIYILSFSGSTTRPHVEYNLIKKIDIFLANKHNKGGQSSKRFGRIVQIVRDNYVDIIVENIINAYMYDNNTKCIVKNIVLAGPGEMKYDVANTTDFKQYFSKYLNKIITTDNPNEGSIYELAESIINDIKYDNVKNVDNELNDLVQYEFDSLIIGKTECLDNIKLKSIKKLFVNKSELDLEQDIKLSLEATKVEVITTNSNILKTYGDWVGIKWYQNKEHEIDELY